MNDLSQIQPHAEVIGSDGVHVGTVDHVLANAIKLTRQDSVDGRHHYIDAGFIASIEGGTVRLSANADVAVSFVESEDADRAEDARLDEGLDETFPASDPVSAKHIT